MTITPLVRPPLSVLAEHPDLGDSLLFQINGLLVVFVALSSIWGTMELMGLFFRRRKIVAAPAGAPLPAVPLPAAEPAIPPGPGPELMAVIAAAVCATAGRHFRICAITPAPESLDWAREGRREIFASHRPR